jgi:quercetin dioxygenase-like cupin family protein
MAYPIVKLGSAGNIYTRMMHFEKAGDIEIGHTHDFNHLTLLANGSLKVTVEGIDNIFKAPHMIWINKDKNHELTALENNTVAYCIHAMRDANGELIDESMIPIGITSND